MKTRRVSLAVKMYAFLIAVIVIVGGLLMFMSAGAYRDTVLELLPAERREDGNLPELTADEMRQIAEVKLRVHLIKSALVLLSVTVVFSVISIVLIRRFLIRPMRSLAQAATEFRPEEDGTYSKAKISKVEVRSEDEIGDLSREIRSMQEEIVENTGNLARMTAEKERIITELDLAREIQASALPRIFPPFPDRTEFDLYASMTPARAVGGDFYDFFFIDDDHLAMVIADVSGKGIPASLFMMVAMALIRDQLMSGRNDPAEAMEMVNRQLCERNESMQFVTVWMAVIEVSTGNA